MTAKNVQISAEPIPILSELQPAVEQPHGDVAAEVVGAEHELAAGVPPGRAEDVAGPTMNLPVFGS